MELLSAFLVLAFFSILSFWQGRGVVATALWLMTAAISLVFGLFWFDTYPDYMGLTLALVFSIAYMVFCVAHSYLAIAKNQEEEG